MDMLFSADPDGPHFSAVEHGSDRSDRCDLQSNPLKRVSRCEDVWVVGQRASGDVAADSQDPVRLSQRGAQLRLGSKLDRCPARSRSQGDIPVILERYQLNANCSQSDTGDDYPRKQSSRDAKSEAAASIGWHLCFQTEGRGDRWTLWLMVMLAYFSCGCRGSEKASCPACNRCGSGDGGGRSRARRQLRPGAGGSM